MKVALDCTSMLGTLTGVGTVTTALCRGLASRPEVDVTAFAVSVRGRDELRAVVPDTIEVMGPALPARAVRLLWRHLDRPGIDRLIGRHDVVHGPNFVVPPTAAARLVTVHDLTPVRFPELCTADAARYPTYIRRAVAAGAWVHTPSHAVRGEVIDHFDVDPDRVVAVPNGFSPMTGGDPERGRRLAGVDEFVLAIGTVEPRKGLTTLLDAVDLLQARGIAAPVVHAGPDGWGSTDFDSRHRRMNDPAQVTRLGRISEQDKADLYAAARLFCYPSVYEGFGLTILEAMSAGTPVVTTDIPAAREVAADAAVFAPVGEVEALADAVDATWHDDQRRAAMVVAGAQRVTSYSWDRMVGGMVDLYARLADPGVSGTHR